MNKKEEIKRLTGNINQMCDVLSRVLENPVLKESLNEEQISKLNRSVAHVYGHFIDFRNNTLKEHPELKKLPWVSEFIQAVKKLKKTMRDFDEIGMSKKDIFLKRKFWRTVFLTETLIKIYEKIVTGQRKPITDLERKVLDNISDRVQKELRSTSMDEFGAIPYNRWTDGIINQNVQIISNVELIKREVC